MAARTRGRTIDPERIVDIPTWIRYYSTYTNLVQRPSDGALLVLKPGDADISNPVKEFQLTKAVDALSYINQGADPELRVQAATKLEILAKERATKAETINAVYRQKERELLQKHREWKQAAGTPDLGLRTLLATEVGVLQKELRDLDTERRETLYPYRSIHQLIVSKDVIDYESRDSRKVEYPIFCGVGQTTVSKDRTLFLQ